MSDDDLETPEATLKFCQDLKLQGNTLFQKGDYASALAAYEKGIMFLDQHDDERTKEMQIVFLSNLVQAQICAKLYDDALNVTGRLLNSAPNHVKGLYRRGLAAAHVRMQQVVDDSISRLRAVGSDVEADELAERSAALLRCNNECAAGDDDEVVGVLLTPSAKATPCGITLATRSRKVLEKTQQFVSPLMKKVGLPYAVVKERRVTGDNQFGTYLMAEVRSGLAPPQWQQGVGELFLFRTDYRRTSVPHGWALWDFLCSAMDYYGDGPNAALEFLTLQSFHSYVKSTNVFLDW